MFSFREGESSIHLGSAGYARLAGESEHELPRRRRLAPLLFGCCALLLTAAVCLQLRSAGRAVAAVDQQELAAAPLGGDNLPWAKALVVLVVVFSVFLLLSPPVLGLLLKMLAPRMFTWRMGVPVYAESVYVNIFSCAASITANNVRVANFEKFQEENMLTASDVYVSFSVWAWLRSCRKIAEINELHVEGVDIYLETDSVKGRTNLQMVQDRLHATKEQIDAFKEGAGVRHKGPIAEETESGRNIKGTERKNVRFHRVVIRKISAHFRIGSKRFDKCVIQDQEFADFFQATGLENPNDVGKYFLEKVTLGVNTCLDKASRKIIDIAGSAKGGLDTYVDMANRKFIDAAGSAKEALSNCMAEPDSHSAASRPPPPPTHTMDFESGTLGEERQAAGCFQSAGGSVTSNPLPAPLAAQTEAADPGRKRDKVLGAMHTGKSELERHFARAHEMATDFRDRAAAPVGQKDGGNSAMREGSGAGRDHREKFKQKMSSAGDKIRRHFPTRK